MQRALKIRDTLLAQNPDDKALLAYKATILCNLGLICTYNGRLEDAERFALRGLAINEGILARFPKDADAKREMASMLNNLGILLSRRKKFAEAATANRRSLQLAEELHGPDHPTTMVTLTNLGKLYSQLGHYQEAESLFLRALSSLSVKSWARTIPTFIIALEIWPACTRPRAAPGRPCLFRCRRCRFKKSSFMPLLP